MEGPVVLYDEDCGFCRWSADKVVRWGRRGGVRARAIQSEQGGALLKDVPESRRLDSWHLALPGGRLRSAGAAVAPLAHRLPGGAPIAALAETFPWATDRLYRLLARNRTRLGKVVGARACAVDPSRGGMGR
jgi:predicted DCC family thiol-disulfide oxidoreductase YuxK